MYDQNMTATRSRARFTGWAVLLLLVLTSLAGAPAGFADEQEELEARRRRLEKAREEFEKSEQAFVERVNKAIDKGVAWLVSQQRNDGYWPCYPGPKKAKAHFPGETGLILMTLAKCGKDLKDRDKVLEKGLRALESYQSWAESHVRWPNGVTGHTYSNAILVLMYDALYAKRPKVKQGSKRGARRTSSKRSKRKKKNPCKYPASIRRKITELVDWLQSVQEKNIWRYPGPEEQNEDLSNAQYALLALQAAGRCGIRVPPEVYKKALAYVLKHQEGDGPEVWLHGTNPAWNPGQDRYPKTIKRGKAKARGWAYMPGGPITGSMTTAGIAALAIIQERLREQDALSEEDKQKIRKAIRDGVGWFSRNFTVDKNPNNGSWHYYYLYGLERAGQLLGVRYMGKEDWYRAGAEYLIRSQREDGSWEGGAGAEGIHAEDDTLRTCFALLFLRRATVPPDVPLGPVTTGD